MRPPISLIHDGRRPGGDTRTVPASTGALVRWAVPLLAVCLLGVPPAGAITFNFDHDEEGEEPSWDPNGSILEAHFEAAADIWEALLPTNEEFSVEYHWDDDIGPSLAHTTDTGAEIFVEVNPNACWFVDPTPNDSVEFNFANAITLYSDLLPALKALWFPGTAPPDNLEVGFRGTGSTTGCFGPAGLNPAQAGFDLLSTVVHELGHTLGIIGIEPGEYNIDPLHVGWLGNVLVKEEVNSGLGESHLAGGSASSWLMCENCASTGERRLPSATDILVVAEEQSHANVKLARVSSISSGFWAIPFLWIGGRVPNATQDVFINSNPGQIDLSADAVARSVTIDGQTNRLKTGANKLTATGGRSRSIHGEFLVDSGGEVDLAGLDLLGLGKLTLDGGLARLGGTVLVDVYPELPAPGMTASIAGRGNVLASRHITNNGEIRADGGTLAFIWNTPSLSPAAWDLDGDLPGEGGKVFATAGDLIFHGPPTDDFDGELRIGEAHSVTFADLWTLGVAGLLEMTTPLATANPATLIGQQATFVDGFIIVSGTGVLDSPVTFRPDADVLVQTAGSRLILEDHTIYQGGSHSGAGLLDQKAFAKVEKSTSIDVRIYDFDGSDEASPSPTQITPGSVFSINSQSIEESSDGYDGEVQVDGGVLEVNTKHFDERANGWVGAPWQIDGGGVLRLRNSRFYEETDSGVGGRARGAPIVIAGRVVGQGRGNRIEAEVLFESNAIVEVDDAEDELFLEGAIEYRGGTFTGDGALHQMGDALVQLDTTIETRVYDWDGNETIPSTMTIGSGRTAWLRPESIDTAADGFDGLVQIHQGTLIVNTRRHEGQIGEPLPWLLGEEGTIDLHDSCSVSGTSNPGALGAAGSPMLAAGQINAHGPGNTIYSPTSFRATAAVRVETGGFLDLAGSTRYEGGSYSGLGTLSQGGPAHVARPTTVDTAVFDLDGPAESTVWTLADDLTFNGTAVDVADNAFDGTMDVVGDAALTIHTSAGDEWVMDGLVNVVGPSPTGLDVEGAPVRMTGTVHVDGGNTVTFHSDVSGNGTFTGSGQVIFLGAYNPGSSPGWGDFAGGVRFGPSAVVRIDLDGPRPRRDHDEIRVAGEVTFAGTLEIEVGEGFEPEPGQRFAVVTYRSHQGTFDQVLGLTLPGGLTLVPEYGDEALTLVVQGE